MRTVLKVLSYQTIYAEKDGRYMHCIANEGHTNDKHKKGNHRNVTKVLFMLIVYMFYHRICWFVFFRQKSCHLLSYKSDTCSRFFFQSVLFQTLEGNLVCMNNKCIHGFAPDNLLLIHTKAAFNSCKRTLWKKKPRTVSITCM